MDVRKDQSPAFVHAVRKGQADVVCSLSLSLSLSHSLTHFNCLNLLLDWSANWRSHLPCLSGRLTEETSPWLSLS